VKIINKIKKLFNICDHKYKLSEMDNINTRIKPNELLIYICEKCGKIKLTTLAINEKDTKKILREIK